MFERKTVFILGAGASWHYNYPTGDGLVSCVLENVNNLIECYDGDLRRNTWHKIDAINNIVNDVNAQPPQISEFLKNFHDRLRYVNPPVIDYFFQSNNDLRDIGKLMIAWTILARETEFEKSGNLNRQRIGQDKKNFNDDWYRYILYQMLIGCESFEDVFQNQVSFITFNYDVSLDHFLYKGLKQIAFMKPDRISDEEIKDELKKRIHHVYGFVREDDQFSDLKMPFIPPGSKTTRVYKDLVNAAYKASQSIDTIAGQKREIPEHVLDKISEAQDIYILGFGFDFMNCESLNAKEFFGHGSSKAYVTKHDYRKVFFTNFQDYNSVNKKVHGIFTLPDKYRFFSNQGHSIYEDYGSLGGEGRGTGGIYYEKSIKNVYDAISEDFGFI